MCAGVRPSIWRASSPTARIAAGVHVFRDDRRLAQNDAFALDVHEHVGRAEIDPDVQVK